MGVHARRAPSEDRPAFQKEIAEIIQKNNDDGIVTAIQDETIVIAAPRARKRGYTRKKIRALYTYTGSHSKTIVFGLITADDRNMFRQHDEFGMHAFAKFIRAAVRKFGKICLILDKAPQHRAKMILRLVDEIDGLTLKFLPTATTLKILIPKYVLSRTERFFSIVCQMSGKDVFLVIISGGVT